MEQACDEYHDQHIVYTQLFIIAIQNNGAQRTILSILRSSLEIGQGIMIEDSYVACCADNKQCSRRMPAHA